MELTKVQDQAGNLNGYITDSEIEAFIKTLSNFVKGHPVVLAQNSTRPSTFFKLVHKNIN